MDQVQGFVGPLGDLTGSGVTVAVIDSGIDFDHPDLQGVLDLARSRSFVTFDDSLTDAVGHGTHVAGIIGGDGSGADGRFMGIAPGVSIVVVRVMSSGGSGYESDVAAGIDYAISLGVDIINYSAASSGRMATGGPGPWAWSSSLRLVEQHFLQAVEEGILCVCAAGNAGPNAATIEPPGLRRELLSVGAVRRDGTVADGSSRGPVYLDDQLRPGSAVRGVREGLAPVGWVKPDVVAPGGDVADISGVFGTPQYRLNVRDGIIAARAMRGQFRPLDGSDRGRLYTKVPGTSQATAVVSGLAAIALEYGRRRGLDWGRNVATSLHSLLLRAAQRPDTGPDTAYGHGILRWPRIRECIDDCLASEQSRQAILGGGQLWLVE